MKQFALADYALTSNTDFDFPFLNIIMFPFLNSDSMKSEQLIKDGCIIKKGAEKNLIFSSLTWSS